MGRIGAFHVAEMAFLRPPTRFTGTCWWRVGGGSSASRDAFQDASETRRAFEAVARNGVRSHRFLARADLAGQLILTAFWTNFQNAVQPDPVWFERPIRYHLSMAEDESSSCDATLLMAKAANGDQAAADRLLPLVYDQLRKAAQMQMSGERCDHTLSATALVHEAYLKLVGPREVAWGGRAHFYAAAAEAMRRILLDHAKSRARVKRGGGLGRVDLDNTAALHSHPEDDDDRNQANFVALDEAICRLATRDPRMAEVVRLRFYAGLEISEVGLVLGVSERTVKGDWAFAKAWLEREVKPKPGAE